MSNPGTYADPIKNETISMYKYLVVIVLLFAGGMAGCRSTKSIRKVIATTPAHTDTTGSAARAAALPVRDPHADSIAVIARTMAGLEHNHVDFQTFSARMHVHFQSDDGKDNEVNAIVHITKDKQIWVQIFGSVGPVTIEAFRVLITPDSAKILDKIKKTVRLRSVSYLQEQVHLPVDFKTIQDILIGNPVYLDTGNILYYRTENKGLSLYSIGAVFSNFLTLNQDFTARHSKVDVIDPLQARTGDFTYGDYDYSGPAPFSTYRKISVQERGKVDIEIIIKQFKFNETLSDNFSIPKNYKRR
jgi:DNA-binding LytR/AlgR family response regulator